MIQSARNHVQSKSVAQFRVPLLLKSYRDQYSTESEIALANSNDCLPMIKELVGFSHRPLLQNDSNSTAEIKSDKNDFVTIDSDTLGSAISG